MEKTAGKSLTTKQTWVLSTVALSGGLTKYNLERLWAQTIWPGRPFRVPLTNDDSFNMRQTLDTLVKTGLLRKDKGKRNITLYHIGSHVPGLVSVSQPYRPYSRKVMTFLSSRYLGDKNGS